ncbi:Bug family tripartite tricarboxylate transporter substrate binding protein [Ottowia thiooxydans]|uniref:Bug family tripartite tricarboxylate transporter substrate binding protein n=1 Tax=Ottowia thiooxydans TaxID=219182 RepID=UPI00048EFAFA|nr:tripartite tricarboxylate transporter substrate binding protein [Ottowia thiooxydans]
MNRTRRQFLHIAAGATAGAGLWLPETKVWAQGRFPDKPISLVVPQPPGGDADAVCRALQTRMQEVLGQPVIIDNRAGAAGNIGVAYGSKAAPDGYTVTFVNQGILAFNPSLYPSTGFSAANLMPVSWLTSTDLVLCANAAFPARTMSEFIELARKSPGKYTYGTAGNGSANHIAAKMLEAMAKIELTHVPYKGGAPAIVDALGGQIDTVMAFPLAALPHIKSGKLKALATTGAKRSSALPAVPTIAESGVPGYEFGSWFGFVVPKGTPLEVVDKLNAAATAALKDPATAEKLRAGLTEPIAGGPAEFAELIARETKRWPPLIKQYGIRLD